MRSQSLFPFGGSMAPILTLAFLLPVVCQSIHLDIHVPLPQGCLYYHALLANRLLRAASRPHSKEDAADKVAQPSEEVNLFSRHTPHVTLYLSDFDLEVDAPNIATRIDNAGFDVAELNQTKVDAFLNVISSLNYTEIIAGQNCPLFFAKDQSTNAFYSINGAYTMLPIETTSCLQTLSATLLHSLQSYLRYPIVVPSWVAELPEPSRSAAIYRSRTYGSANVLDGFQPHVTVGFDPNSDTSTAMYEPISKGSFLLRDQTSLQWRDDAMKQWNEAYEQVHETCIDEVQGIALGKTSVGGTVLTNSRMGYWNLAHNVKDDAPHDANQKGLYATVE